MSLFTEDVVLRRKNTQSYFDANGEQVDGAEITVDIKASVQPYEQKIGSKVLPQGVISEDALTIYSESEIRQYKPKTATEDKIDADELTFGGYEFVCHQAIYSFSAAMPTMSFYEAVFIRKDQAPNRS